MTYAELVDQKPSDVIDGETASERKRSASPPERETMVQKRLKFE